MTKNVERASRFVAVERFVITPVIELVLGLREAFSPEMTKARSDAMFPELQRLGSVRFTIDRMARTIGVTVPVGTLIRVGPLLAKGAGWGVFTDPKTLRYISVLVVLSVFISLYSACAAIARLRRENPGQV